MTRSFAYIRSTSASKSVTAWIKRLSAGPDINCNGLIMSGFIGLVEFGSMTGNQFAAGRSYHGADASPCMAGMMNGASFEDFAADAPAPSLVPFGVDCCS